MQKKKKLVPRNESKEKSGDEWKSYEKKKTKENVEEERTERKKNVKKERRKFQVGK